MTLETFSCCLHEICYESEGFQQQQNVMNGSISYWIFLHKTLKLITGASVKFTEISQYKVDGFVFPTYLNLAYSLSKYKFRKTLYFLR